ncbi:unnamed protein product, partial [Alternaria burnsii]
MPWLCSSTPVLLQCLISSARAPSIASSPPPRASGTGPTVFPYHVLSRYRVIALSHDIIVVSRKFQAAKPEASVKTPTFRSRTTRCHTVALRQDVLIVMAIADTTQRPSSSIIERITATTSSQGQAPVPSRLRLRLRLRLQLPLSSYEYPWLSSGSIVQGNHISCAPTFLRCHLPSRPSRRIDRPPPFKLTLANVLEHEDGADKEEFDSEQFLIEPALKLFCAQVRQADWPYASLYPVIEVTLEAVHVKDDL